MTVYRLGSSECMSSNYVQLSQPELTGVVELLLFLYEKFECQIDTVINTKYSYIVRLLPPKWYYFRGAGSKATCGYFNEKPHTIGDDMVSHHVITLFFVLLATRSIQKTVPSVGWQKLW